MTKPRWANYHTSTDSMTRWVEKLRFDKLNDYLWEKRIHHVGERDKHPPLSQEYNLHSVMSAEYERDQETLKHTIEQMEEGKND